MSPDFFLLLTPIFYPPGSGWNCAEDSATTENQRSQRSDLGCNDLFQDMIGNEDKKHSRLLLSL